MPIRAFYIAIPAGQITTGVCTILLSVFWTFGTVFVNIIEGETSTSSSDTSDDGYTPVTLYYFVWAGFFVALYLEGDGVAPIVRRYNCRTQYRSNHQERKNMGRSIVTLPSLVGRKGAPGCNNSCTANESATEEGHHPVNAVEVLPRESEREV